MNFGRYRKPQYKTGLLTNKELPKKKDFFNHFNQPTPLNQSKFLPRNRCISKMMVRPSEETVLMNENIMPVPRSAIERKLIQSKLNKTQNVIMITEEKKKIYTPNITMEEITQYEKPIIHKEEHKPKPILLKNKPLFMISTKNCKLLNRKSCIGGIIADVQSRLPPILYRVNRGDNTSLLPYKIRINTNEIIRLNIKNLLKEKNDDLMNLSIFLRKK